MLLSRERTSATMGHQAGGNEPGGDEGVSSFHGCSTKFIRFASPSTSRQFLVSVR